MGNVQETLAAYEGLTLAEAAREAERLYREVSERFLALSLLYDRHDHLCDIQPVNAGECFGWSFDESWLEVRDAADRWSDAADILEDGETAYFLAGADDLGNDRRLRGPYTDPSEPEDWMRGGYKARAGIRVETVTPEAFADEAGLNDDLREAAGDEECEGCGRPSVDCSVDPCPSVIADRGED